MIIRGALVTIVLTVSAAAHADTPLPDPCACSPNKPGFHRAGALTGDWGGIRGDLFQRGVKVTATYTPEVFAAPQLEHDRAVVAGLGSLAIDVELATLLGKHLGAVHVAGFAIHGRGLSQQLMDVYGVSNNAAPEDVRLFEAWLDQPLGPLSVRAGLLAADQEFTLASHSVVLINATFGVAGIVSYDVLGPVYPVAALGASATLDLGRIVARAAVYDGDNTNDHGLPNAIGDDSLAFGELEYAETFKVGGWRHSALGRGLYAIVDRQLERYVGAFARVAASTGPLDAYADTGIRIGPGPLRRRDFASIGMAFASTNDAGNATIVEATYQYLVRGWLTVQPDAQLLFDHNGTRAIVAARMVIAL